MRNTAIVSAAFVATAALAQGTAHVVNQCSYDVHLCNVPAAGGGYSEIDQVLSAGGGSYSQEWTQLSNDNGWSIKLAKTPNYQTDVMQYEYTFHNDGTIWYDLSEVDGNPWNGNWMITASDGCSPKQAAYRYSTDDAYGMQSCADSASITVTLCSGDSQGGSDDSSSAGSSPAATPATSSPEAPAYTARDSTEQAATSPPAAIPPQPTGNWGGYQHTWQAGDKGVVNAAGAKPTPSPTTLVTHKVSVSSAPSGYDVTVTDIATEIVTAYVTASAPPAAKRHEHHVRHPHQPVEA